MNKLLASSVIGVAIVTIVTGCASQPEQVKSVTPEAHITVTQTGMASNTEFVTCKGCATHTRKVVALPPPPPEPVAVAAPQIAKVAAPPEPKVFKIHFRFGSAVLDKAGRKELASAVAATMADLNNNVPAEIKVLGRTDPMGSMKYNKRLALSRATTVRRGLIAAGVPAKAIKAERHDPCCDGDRSDKAQVQRDLRRADVEIIIMTTK
jgi:outer membrane protein OmpA-like peptidoglycan-associated protein